MKTIEIKADKIVAPPLGIEVAERFPAFFKFIDFFFILNYNSSIMDYSWKNKIKGRLFNKVTRALHQNNFLTNLIPYSLNPLLPSESHSERSEESLKKISKPHDCIPFNTGKILKQVQDDSATSVNTLGFARILEGVTHFLTNLFHITRHSEQSGATHVDTLVLPSTRHPERSEGSHQALHEILRLKPQGATHVGMFDYNRRAAFTLAEVLITLGIIGVVAALTIPNLIVKYEKNRTVTQLKKTYSVLNQAYLFAKADGGDSILAENIIGDYDNNLATRNYVENFMSKYFTPYLKITKNCGYTSDSSCFGKNYIRSFANGNPADSGITYYKYNLILNDGTFISVTTNTRCDENGENCVSGGGLIFYIDISGGNKPNMFGKDTFIFYITPKSSNIDFYKFGNTRTALLNNCNNAAGFRQSCAALIKYDGWKISDDYLW